MAKLKMKKLPKKPKAGASVRVLENYMRRVKEIEKENRRREAENKKQETLRRKVANIRRH